MYFGYSSGSWPVLNEDRHTLTFELCLIKDILSTELMSSKSSTPSARPERDERFSQLPEAQVQWLDEENFQVNMMATLRPVRVCAWIPF